MKQLFVLMLLATTLFAANAVPVAITSTTVAGSVVTVNATAHGLLANQGFCANALSICGVVVTVSANQFTFTAAAQTACSTSCGAVAPAPQVISLKQSAPSQGQTTYTYLLWLTTQQPCPGPNSAWQPANGSGGASLSQNTALNAGWFIETEAAITVASNTPVSTVQALLQNAYFMEEQRVSTNVQPCQYYGQVFDGIGWAKQ